MPLPFTDAELNVHGKAKARGKLLRSDVADMLRLHKDKKKPAKRERAKAWLEAYYTSPEGMADAEKRTNPDTAKPHLPREAVQRVLDNLDSYPEYHEEP